MADSPAVSLTHVRRRAWPATGHLRPFFISGVPRCIDRSVFPSPGNPRCGWNLLLADCRADFELPANLKGKDLRLWFGGFDHHVDVYLKGQSVGELNGFMQPGEGEKDTGDGGESGPGYEM